MGHGRPEHDVKRIPWQVSSRLVHVSVQSLAAGASHSWGHGHGANGENELTGLAVDAPTSRRKSRPTLFSTGAMLERVGLGSKQDACRVFLHRRGWRREFCRCVLHAKHTFMDPPSSSPEVHKKRRSSRERGVSRCPDLAGKGKCDSEMHRLCGIMLKMAPRVLSVNGKSYNGWRRDFCPCLAEDGFLSEVGVLMRTAPSVPFTTQTH